MTSDDKTKRSHKVAGAIALGLGAAGAVGWALQHRSVSKAVATEKDFESEGLTLPDDVIHHFVEAEDGARIHVVERGAGPVVVLLHGFMLDSTIWANEFRDLAGTHRLIAVDQRGHGRSELGSGFSGAETLREAAPMARAGRGAPAIRRLAGDLLRVLESLDISEALLVGHSMGGMVALQLAQDHPEVLGKRVTGLVLVSTMAGPFAKVPGWSNFARVAAPVSARAVLLADRVGARAIPVEDVRYWLSRMGFGADASATQVRFVESLHRSTSPRTLSGLLASLAVFDLSSSLDTIEIPALVVVGSHDRLTPPRQARRMASALAHAQLIELARCGHMPMIERPHEFSHLIEEFAAKTRTR